ncbi:MAG TPA: hypothetical protein VHX86_01400 [Tepidisphaeraceae bacterium]|jgi:hypothetical protein|nr:hypothetical protein [Tepidisphaeraceae bacterium]
MPPVGPQGSRGGLITAVVVFTILFVTATIFAIYFGVDDNKKTELLTTQTSRTKEIYSAQDMLSQRYKDITKNPRPGQTVLQVAFQDAQNLAELINGKTAANAIQPSAAADQARNALTDAGQRVPSVQLTTSMSLVEAINKLAAYASGQHYENQALRQAQLQGAGDAAKQIALSQTLVKKAQDDLADANKIKQDALDQTQKAQNDAVIKIQQMSQSMDQERREQNAELQRAQQLVETKDQQLDQEKRLATELGDKLAGKRISPIDPLLRQSDGMITSVASDDIVYINLGMGDHLVPGLTFEVYDRRDGVPKQDDLLSEENLPVGKGSIEVEQVYATDSRCRVIKTEVGQHLAEGDLIANLVYDRNTKYNFVVYGNFDLAQTGQPKPADRQKIEALVTEWGGHVQKDINVDTDFVVMGAVPEIRQFTEDELQDPLNRRLQDDEKAEYAAYSAELDKAKELHIPIMNQNRFLYFCGYYDNAQR